MSYNDDRWVDQDVTIGSAPSFSVLALTDVTDSSSTSTGALIVPGGVGIAKNVYIGQALNVASATDATSTSTGSIVTSGGIGVAKSVYIGGSFSSVVASGANYLTLDSANSQFAMLSIQKGDVKRWELGKDDVVEAGETGASFALRRYNTAGTYQDTPINVSRDTGNIYMPNVLSVGDTTDSTSTTTGAFKVSGGVGIAKKMYVGDTVYADDIRSAAIVMGVFA